MIGFGFDSRTSLIVGDSGTGPIELSRGTNENISQGSFRRRGRHVPSAAQLVGPQDWIFRVLSLRLAENIVFRGQSMPSYSVSYLYNGLVSIFDRRSQLRGCYDHMGVYQFGDLRLSIVDALEIMVG